MIGPVCRHALRQTTSQLLRAVANGSPIAVSSASRLMRSATITAQSNRFFTTSILHKSLSDVLNREIEAEMDLAQQQGSNKVSPVPGWTTVNKEAVVELTKKHANETILVTFNVNHSLAGEGEELNAEEQQGGIATMTPAFRVEVKRGDSSLVFECEPFEHQEMAEQGGAPFELVEIYMYRGKEPSDDCYTTSGGIIDSSLYDQFMVYLDERGINNQLLSDIDAYTGAYEHSLYLDLLKNIKQFTSA